MAREIRAAAPAPEAEALRKSYLDLLKLSLCDLTGSSTTSVEGRPRGGVASRELTGEELGLRASGRDWPAHGLTMTGLTRLDDLQSCVEEIVRSEVPGDLIEAGSWRGGASILIRATLDGLGASERTLWVADSFQGFRHVEHDGVAETHAYTGTLEPYLGAFDYLSAPLDEVKANFARFGLEHGVRFVPGFFEDTLAGIAQNQWSLVRVDSDTYDPTLLTLRCLYPGLSPGGYVIIDDYGDFEECRAAVDRFRSENDIVAPLESVDWSCVRWRRGEDSATLPVIEPAGSAAPSTASRVRRQGRIPTQAELHLEEQLVQIRAELAATQAELVAAREFERLLDEVTHSTSWRLTRPARELAERARHRAPDAH